MKPGTYILWSLVALAACSGPEPQPLCPTVVVTVAGVGPPTAPQRPAAERAVVRHFDRIKVRELGVVFGEGITAGQIGRIHVADQEARAALTRLGRHPTAVLLDDARVKVQALEAALEPPGETP